MRTIGRLNDERQAATLVDYLLTLGIKAKAERSDASTATQAESAAGAEAKMQPSWELWVFDEDQLPKAKEALQAFRDDPTAERFLAASREADRLRHAAAEEELAIRRQQRKLMRKANPSSSGRRPVTMMLFVASCAVFIMTDGGHTQAGAALIQKLSISSFTPIGDNLIEYPKIPFVQITRDGEWWRIISPILIHFDLIHLAFNMLCLFDFGTQVEALRGSRKMLFFTLVFGAAGNAVQFLVEGPAFGGMSGVVYGLFGYVWMKSQFEPESGFVARPLTTMFLVAWFFLGVLYEFIPITKMANYCHGVGLLLGLLFGYLPTLLRSLRRTGKSD